MAARRSAGECFTIEATVCMLADMVCFGDLAGKMAAVALAPGVPVAKQPERGLPGDVGGASCEPEVSSKERGVPRTL